MVTKVLHALFGLVSRARRVLGSERGALLAEIVIAIGAFTMLGTAVLSSVQTAHLSQNRFEDRSTAENLLRNQVAYVLEQAYASPGSDYLDIAAPAGFTIDTQVLAFDSTSDDSLSRVTIAVFANGTEVYSTETVRTAR